MRAHESPKPAKASGKQANDNHGNEFYRMKVHQLNQKAIGWWREQQGIEVTRIPFEKVPEELKIKVIGVDKTDELASMAFPVGRTIEDVREIRKSEHLPRQSFQ